MAQAKLLAKDGSPCPYCHRTMDINDFYLRPTTDHVKPKSKGLSVHKHKKGAKKYGRTIIVCSACNYKKANYSLQEFVYNLQVENSSLLADKSDESIVLWITNRERIQTIQYLIKIGIDKE